MYSYSNFNDASRQSQQPTAAAEALTEYEAAYAREADHVGLCLVLSVGFSLLTGVVVVGYAVWHHFSN